MKLQTTWLYRYTDGSFTQETWSHTAGDLQTLLADAHRDARLLACGRELLALIAADTGPPETHAVPDDPTRNQRWLLAELGLIALPSPSAPPATHPVDWHIDPTALPWFVVEGPYGSGCVVALELLRCARIDDAGRETAAWLGEAIAHQSTLYPVTPVALPFVIDLLLARVPGHEMLAGWLLVVAEATASVGRATPDEAWQTLARQVPSILREALETSTKAHVRAALRIQKGWRPLAKRLRSDVRIHDLVAPTLDAMRDFDVR
jgi:hypothetical protein